MRATRRAENSSPDGAKRNPGTSDPHCASLHAGYGQPALHSAANAPRPGATGCRATLQFFLRPREGGGAPTGASFWDPRDQNQGLHPGPSARPAFVLLNAGRLSALHRGVLSLAPFFRARFANAGSGPVPQGPWPRPGTCAGISNHATDGSATTRVSDRSTSSTSTTADPGNRRGRTRTRPPKDPGLPPGPWAPHPLHLRTSSGRRPSGASEINTIIIFLFSNVNNN